MEASRIPIPQPCYDANGNEIKLTPIPIENMYNCVFVLQRQQRDLMLNLTDKYVNVPDFPLTPEQKQEILDYRQALRDYFSAENVRTWQFSFENQQLPPLPTKPSFFKGF